MNLNPQWWFCGALLKSLCPGRKLGGVVGAAGIVDVVNGVKRTKSKSYKYLC